MGIRGQTRAHSACRPISQSFWKNGGSDWTTCVEVAQGPRRAGKCECKDNTLTRTATAASVCTLCRVPPTAMPGYPEESFLCGRVPHG